MCAWLSEAARGPDQRELPLRRGRAAVPPRRLRRQGDRVPPRVRTQARRDRTRAAAAHQLRRGRRRQPGRQSRATSARSTYEAALAGASPAPRLRRPLRATTSTSSTPAAPPGMPKGVMWRAEDIFFGGLGGGNLGDAPITRTGGDRRAARPCGRRTLPACPLMHGTAHWFALRRRSTRAARSSCRPIAASTRRDCGSSIARERVTFLVIVGDAFARRWSKRSTRSTRPLDLSSLTVVLSGGAILSPTVEAALGREAARARSSSTASARRRRAGRAAASPRPAGRSRPRRAFASTTRPRCSTTTSSRRAGPASIGRLARRGHVPARVLQGPGEDRGDVPRRRRRALVGARRPRAHRGRRHDHRARARLGVDQHRRREGVPRGGRGGGEVARRGVRRRRRRRARRALGRAGRRRGAAPTGRDAHLDELAEHVARPTLAGYKAPRDWCWSTPSCARRRASPTTAGRERPLRRRRARAASDLLHHADAVADRQEHHAHALVLDDGVVERRGWRRRSRRSCDSSMTRPPWSTLSMRIRPPGRSAQAGSPRSSRGSRACRRR